jgi:hypothetical protein
MKNCQSCIHRESQLFCEECHKLDLHNEEECLNNELFLHRNGQIFDIKG